MALRFEHDLNMMKLTEVPIHWHATHGAKWGGGVLTQQLIHRPQLQQADLHNPDFVDHQSADGIHIVAMLAQQLCCTLVLTVALLFLGACRYVGMFKDGMRHGEGSLWYSSGARYEGQWEDDKKQGHGVYVFEDGSTFKGQFAADKPGLDAGTLQGAMNTLPLAAAAETGICTTTATANASAAADAQAAAANGATATATDMACGVSGFGPRVSTLQLYISDLLQECDAPQSTYTAVGNLLVGHNTELRALYDRYW